MPKNRNKLCLVSGCFAVGCLLLFLSGCTRVEEYDLSSDEQTEVSFSCYLSQSKQDGSTDTRAIYPTGGNGSMTTSKLKTTGFGVFAFHSGDDTYDYEGTGIGTAAYNFMWNQQVEWDSDHWTYAPVKYWPNDNQPADNQTPPAQGSQEHSYVSFFAYAPYQDVADPLSGMDVTGTAANSGIVKVVNNSTASGNSYLTYRTSSASPFAPDDNVDLLWANQPNLWKTKASGEGYVNGNVNFLFKHALSKLTIYVQGLFDHRDNDDATPDYPSDVDGYTRILIESVDFSNSPLMKQGNMYLAARPNGAATPYWETVYSDSLHVDISGFDINPVFANTYIDVTAKKYGKNANGSDFLEDTDFDGDGDFDTDDARERFNSLPPGVSHTERSLFDDGDFYFMVIPNKTYITDHPTDVMKVHMVYYVITYDPNLTLNSPSYYSIVKNDILATFTSSFSFEPNKQYKLLLMPGLTTVKFQLSVADEWDTPVVVDPVVIDWYVEKKEFDVE